MVSARDAAITLLALTTGLRACDIIALRLADADWRGQTIGVVQQKTGNPLTLPMPALVMGKLAGYVLGERPRSAGDHLFVRSVAPHVRLADHASVHRVIAETFRKAGVTDVKAGDPVPAPQRRVQAAARGGPAADDLGGARPRQRGIGQAPTPFRNSLYKGHIAVDPDSEIITATGVTPGNSGDAEAADGHLADILPAAGAGDGAQAGAGASRGERGRAGVYGDAAYGSGELLERVEDADLHNGIKVQPPTAVKGHFPKDCFAIDLDARTVTCPAGVTVPIRARAGGRHAGRPVRRGVPRLPAGRSMHHRPGRSHHHHRLTRGQAGSACLPQADPAWQADYKATRPKVERKTGHRMRRRHGGRRARVRGQAKVAADFTLLAAAVNLARLAALGVASRRGNWATAST